MILIYFSLSIIVYFFNFEWRFLLFCSRVHCFRSNITLQSELRPLCGHGFNCTSDFRGGDLGIYYDYMLLDSKVGKFFWVNVGHIVFWAGFCLFFLGRTGILGVFGQQLELCSCQTICTNLDFLSHTAFPFFCHWAFMFVTLLSLCNFLFGSTCFYVNYSHSWTSQLGQTKFKKTVVG